MIKVINIKGGEASAERDDPDVFFSSDSEENESIMSGGSVVRALSKDPMFLVFTKFFVSKKGNNIADILEEIKDHLAFLRHNMA